MEAKERMEARGGISLKTGGRGVAAGKSRSRGGNRREIRGGRKSASSRHIRGDGECGDGECGDGECGDGECGDALHRGKQQQEG